MAKLTSTLVTTLKRAFRYGEGNVGGDGGVVSPGIEAALDAVQAGVEEHDHSGAGAGTGTGPAIAGTAALAVAAASEYLPGFISADADGRALIEADFFNEATLEDKILDDALTAAVLANKLAANALSAAVVAAAVANGAVGVAKLEEGAKTFVDVQLTNAQMLAVRATPIQLVATPGANKAVVVDDVHMVSSAAAGAYTETADNLVVEYGDGTDIVAVETTGFVDQASVQVREIKPNYSALFTPLANQLVQLKNSGDGEFGGGNAANTFSLRVHYHVVDMVAFT